MNKLIYRWHWFRINFRYAFRPGKPLVVLRILRNYFRMVILKKNLLRYVDCSIGWKCNMNCKHCFASYFEDSQRKIMSPDDYARMSREAMTMGAVNFSFQGGEPLLYKELFQIIKSVRPSRNLISVTTNGFLLDRGMIKKLKENKVDILTISIDSGIAREHDEFRNFRGSFHRALRGILLAKRAGINVTVGCVVTHQNLHSEGIKRLMKVCTRLRVILMLIYAVPTGKWKDNQDAVLTAEDIEHIRDTVKTNPYIRTDFYANYLNTGCGAGKEILYLTPYGDILSCPFIHMSFGNIFEESLTSIRRNILKIQYFSTWWPYCLAGEDRGFIDRYMSRINQRDKFPVHYREILK